MTNNTQGASAPAVFSFESTAIRTFSDDYGNPIFCASDVCDVLGYVNGRQAVQKNCHQDGVSTRDIIDSMGRAQQITVITEGNLYRLLVKSRKEEAVRFEKWMMEELLPTIRKTGRYQMPGADGLRPTDLAAGHTLPAIDVNALLLQGQSSSTIQLPADILQAIDQRAFVLAHEAYTACREHLTRAVAYRCETDKPRRINRARALALISQCDLNQALAHSYYSRLRMIADLAECAQRTASALYTELHQFSNPNPPGALPG